MKSDRCLNKKLIVTSFAGLLCAPFLVACWQVGVVEKEADSAKDSSGDDVVEDSDSETGDGLGSLIGEMTDLHIHFDFMPGAIGFFVYFDLTLTNIGDAPATAMVISANLVDEEGMDVGTIEVVPTEIGPVPAGESQTADMSNVQESLVPESGWPDCYESLVLELVLDENGVQSIVSDSDTMDCTY